MSLAELHQDWRARKQAVARLASDRDLNGAATADQLVALISAESLDLGVLNGALQTLVALGRPALERLRPLLTHELSEVRQAAAVVLGQLQPPLGVPMLRHLLEDGDTNVRYHAVEALGQQGARSAVPKLADLAVSGDAFLAFAAVEALACIGDPRALPELVSLLPDPMLGGMAAEALGRIGHPLALGPLRACLESSPEPEQVRQALNLLSPRETDEPRPTDLQTVLAALPGENARQRHELVESGLGLGTPPTVWLRSEQVGLRAAAARWLVLAGQLGGEELLGWWRVEADERARCEMLEICSDEMVLTAALRSAGAAESALAVRRLAELPVERGMPLLQSLPRRSDFWWSIYLCRTLGHWRAGVKWLRELLVDERPPVRAEAARALARADAELAARLLPALLQDPEPDVSEAALRGLALAGEWQLVAEAGDLELLSLSPRPEDLQRALAELPETFEFLATGPNAPALADLELSQAQWHCLNVPVSFEDADPWRRREALFRDYAGLRTLALVDQDDRIRDFASMVAE